MSHSLATTLSFKAEVGQDLDDVHCRIAFFVAFGLDCRSRRLIKQFWLALLVCDILFHTRSIVSALRGNSLPKLQRRLKEETGDNAGKILVACAEHGGRLETRLSVNAGKHGVS